MKLKLQQKRKLKTKISITYLNIEARGNWGHLNYDLVSRSTYLTLDVTFYPYIHNSLSFCIHRCFFPYCVYVAIVTLAKERWYWFCFQTEWLWKLLSQGWDKLCVFNSPRVNFYPSFVLFVHFSPCTLVFSEWVYEIASLLINRTVYIFDNS